MLLVFLLWTVNTFSIFSNRIPYEFISSSSWSLQTPHWNTTLLLLTFIFFSTKIGHFWNVIVGVRNVQHWKSHLSTFGIFWSADSDYRTCRKTRERRHVASRHVTCLLYESYTAVQEKRMGLRLPTPWRVTVVFSDLISKRVRGTREVSRNPFWNIPWNIPLKTIYNINTRPHRETGRP